MDDEYQDEMVQGMRTMSACPVDSEAWSVAACSKETFLGKLAEEKRDDGDEDDY